MLGKPHILGTDYHLSVRGGRLKSRGGGGHVNFHVASRAGGGGSPLTLTSQQGGVMFKLFK